MALRSLAARCSAARSIASGEPASTTRGGPWRRTVRRRASPRLNTSTNEASTRNAARLRRGIRYRSNTDEGEPLHGHADRGGEKTLGQPGPPPESWLAFVQPGEVVDGEVDRGGDRESDEVVRQRVRVPIEREPESHEADHDHQQIQRHRIERAEHPEPAGPQPGQWAREEPDDSFDRSRERLRRRVRVTQEP